MPVDNQIEHPETAKLAKKAYEKSGCRTHQEFCDLFGGAIGLRTFRGWLKGQNPAAPIATLLLSEFVMGWRPRCGSGVPE